MEGRVMDRGRHGEKAVWMERGGVRTVCPGRAEGQGCRQTDRQTDACPRAGRTRCPCTHQQVLPVPGWAFCSRSAPSRWPHPGREDGCTPHRGARGRPVPGGTRLGTPCGTAVSPRHVAPARERGRHAFPVARRSGWMPPVLFICLMHVGSAALTANGTFPICHGWLSPQPATGPAATAASQTRGGEPCALPAPTCCSPSSLALTRPALAPGPQPRRLPIPVPQGTPHRCHPPPSPSEAQGGPRARGPRYLSMMTGSEGVSLRFPQLFLSQQRLGTAGERSRREGSRGEAEASPTPPNPQGKTRQSPISHPCTPQHCPALHCGVGGSCPTAAQGGRAGAAQGPRVLGCGGGRTPGRGHRPCDARARGAVAERAPLGYPPLSTPPPRTMGLGSDLGFSGAQGAPQPWETLGEPRGGSEPGVPQPHAIPRGLHLTHGGHGSAGLVPPPANKRGGAGPGECSGEGGPPGPGIVSVAPGDQLAALAWSVNLHKHGARGW